MDPMWIAVAEKSVKALRTLVEAGKKLDRAEIKKHIAELENAHADAGGEIAELKRRVLELEAENEELRRRKETEEEPLGIKWGCYYFEPEPKVLYCIKCWEKERRRSPTNRFSSKVRVCAVCETPIPTR